MKPLIILVVKTQLALITTGLAVAFSLNAIGKPILNTIPTSDHQPANNSRPPVKAPEISTESAAISLALLTGVLLLVSERSRKQNN